VAVGKNFKQGLFVPKNPQKYIGDVSNIYLRSSYEFRFAEWCDRTPSVLQWNCEGIVVPYYSNADAKARRYFVDFYVKYKISTGEIREEIIEIKPKVETQPPARKKGKKLSRYQEELYTYNVNINKWQAASEYARIRGWNFRILTEEELFK